jgi:DNA-binding PadR family transcriptional regulator
MIETKLDKEILKITANAPHPVGWYGISIRLGQIGIIPKSNLPEALQNLVNLGYLNYEASQGTHGVYTITDQGIKFLEKNAH